MQGFQFLGKILIIFGFFIVILGVLLLIGEKLPYIGRLPGDILIQRKNLTFYFPIMTSILLSIILTLIIWLLTRR